VLTADKISHRLRAPKNAEIINGPLGHSWFDASGVLNTVIRDTPVTLEKMKDSMALLTSLANGRKLCFMVDATYVHPQDQASKDYAWEELPKIFKAIAVISNSQLGKIVTNIFLKLKRPPVHVKLFLTEREAREWIGQHCREPETRDPA
jgi:hypothetical protein